MSVFECRGCLLRLSRAFSYEALAAGYVGRSHLPDQRQSVRKLSSHASTTARERARERFDRTRSSQEKHPGSHKINQRSSDAVKKKKVDVRSQLDIDLAAQDEKELRLELKYLSDPIKLTEYIKRILSNDDLPKALALVRFAGKERPITITWNHVLDWTVQRDVKTAFKLYNEMKKRGQEPDSYTIMTLLRGVAKPGVEASELGQALALYHSLDAPNSKVRRNHIHRNIMLSIASFANDMDALWSVVAGMDERGPGSADKQTYTVILNSIREDALRQVEDGVSERLGPSVIEETVRHSKKIWEEIMGRWQKGDITIDEELVCALGNTLLISEDVRDWDSILSLVDQTMNIPRQIPKLGSPERSGSHIPQLKARLVEGQQTRKEVETETSLESRAMTEAGAASAASGDDDADGREDGWTTATEDFQELAVRNTTRDGTIFVTPGSRTISLILRVCANTFAPSAAHAYWKLFSSWDDFATHAADVEHFHAYLRILRVARASERAVDLVVHDLAQATGKGGPSAQRTTFRIAISAVTRDRRNPNAIRHATRLIEHMRRASTDQVSVQTLQKYLDFVSCTGSLADMVTACNVLVPYLKTLQLLAQAADDYSRPRGGKELEADAYVAHRLLHDLVGHMNRLLSKDAVSRELLESWTKRRNYLTAWVQNLVHRLNGPRRDRSEPRERAVKEDESTTSTTTVVRDTPTGRKNGTAYALARDDRSDFQKPSHRPSAGAYNAATADIGKLEYMTRRLQSRKESRQRQHFREREMARGNQSKGFVRVEPDNAFSDSPMDF